LSEVSDQLGVERHTVEKVIREFRGETFRQYRGGLLLSKAVELLTTKPLLTVKEIAGTLGYGDPRAFARFVKDATGKSPKEIRAQRSIGVDS